MAWSLRKQFSSRGANSLQLKLLPLENLGNIENGGVVSPESISVHLKHIDEYIICRLAALLQSYLTNGRRNNESFERRDPDLLRTSDSCNFNLPTKLVIFYIPKNWDT